MVGLEVREAKVCVWLVVVAKDTLALPSIDTLPVTEPVSVIVRAVDHLEEEATLELSVASILLLEELTKTASEGTDETIVYVISL